MARVSLGFSAPERRASRKRALVCAEMPVEAMFKARSYSLRAEISKGDETLSQVGENCGKGSRRRVKGEQQERSNTVNSEPESHEK